MGFQFNSDDMEGLVNCLKQLQQNPGLIKRMTDKILAIRPMYSRQFIARQFVAGVIERFNTI